MTVAMRAVGVDVGARPEVIRLGIVREDGRLEEKSLSLDGPVTLGSHASASLVVAGLAQPHVLVTRNGDSIVLHVGAGMQARVVTNGATREISGQREDVPLDARGRGKLTVGGVTILFQLAPAQPKRARPALPTAVRPSLFQHLDWLFTAFVAASFLGHFGFVVYLESADYPLSAGLDSVPDHVAELIFVEPDEPETSTDDRDPDEVADAEDPSTDETPTEVAETRPTPRTDRTEHTAPTPMTREEASLAMSDAADSVSQLLIGAPGQQSSIIDALHGGSPMESMEEVMGQVAGGVQIAGVSSTLRERVGSTDVPGSTDLGGLRAVQTRTGPVQEGREVAERGPTLRTTIPDDDDIDVDGVGEFDQRAVVRMIQTRRAQITACYEHAILSDPTLRGRIEIQMTIEESGSVSRVRTTENGMGSDAVARCIENRVRGFRFSPGPTGGSVEFRFPFVFEQQQR